MRKAGKPAGWHSILWFSSSWPFSCLINSGYIEFLSEHSSLSSLSSVLLGVFMSGSSLSEDQVLYPPRLGEGLSIHLQAVLCLLVDTRGQSWPSLEANTLQGAHFSERRPLLGISVLEFASNTLPEPHSWSCIRTHALSQFQGETAVLETFPLHTPFQKYKNTTRFVRRNTHPSPTSPYFIPNSSW